MKDLWIVYKKDSSYDKPAKTYPIAAFEDEGKAMAAKVLAEKSWGEPHDSDYVFYKGEKVRVFDDIGEMACWNDFPKKLFEN